MPITLHGARLVDAFGERSERSITLDGSKIVGLDDSTAASQTINVSDMIITPGFVDVHTHGGGGFSLHTTNADEILDYARWVASTGTTSFLIGVVGVPHTLPKPSYVQQFQPQGEQRPER
jgi:N-acetylglucosamine-6-phosphate deacetylase